jgi:cystathionine beta-lyase
MQYNFDIVPDRRSTNSMKWNKYPEEVLPLWVADMDFTIPQPVQQALQERIAHGIFGYGMDMPELSQVLVERMAQQYQWHIKPEDVVLIPGVVTGFNLACHAFASPGEGVIMQTPVYFPFFSAPVNAGLQCQKMELSLVEDGSYIVDQQLFSDSITAATRLFLLCNPHNPVGRVFRRDELSAMARTCSQKKVVIVSDDIHCDLVYPPHPYTPIASLDDEIAQNTITLIAPSKTFNIPGLFCSAAIIQNPRLRKQFQQARKGLVGAVNVLAQVAALAAYKDGQEWLDQVLLYLQANRDFLVQTIRQEMPAIKIWAPEGTFLAWLDCRQLALAQQPCEHFLEHARVALNDGASFGSGGEGFVRLNFGCPRATLVEALQRMKASLGS